MDKKIVFAGGCFWGTQALFSRVKGVKSTQSGYANSRRENPSYEQVCAGVTGAAEAVELIYDNEIVDLEKLLRIFLRSIDPTSLDRQGGDIGKQYRSGIYYIDEADLPVIQQVLDKEQEKYSLPIVTERMKLGNFYPAEEYHQDYLIKNPNGYCHVNLNILKEFEE